MVRSARVSDKLVEEDKATMRIETKINQEVRFPTMIFHQQGKELEIMPRHVEVHWEIPVKEDEKFYIIVQLNLF